MRFSSRIPSDWTPSPWFAAVQALREQAKLQARPIFDLTVSSPLSAGITWPAEDLCKSLTEVQSWLQWTPDACGSVTARKAVCAYETQRGNACDPEEFILTASTSEAYSILFKTLCDPKDAILVPRPGYPLLDVLAGFDHLECIGYNLQYEGAWQLDWPSLDFAPDRVRAILVVNPNNPTGSVLSAKEWARLVEFCAFRKLALIIDEVFADFPQEQSPAIDWRAMAKRIPIFRLNGLSKSAGLPQIKLSWMWFGCPDADRSDLQNALEFVADAYLNLSALPEALTPYLLQNQGAYRDAVLARVRQNLTVVQELLTGIADVLPTPQAGWYQCAHFAGIDDEQFAIELAQQYGVFIQPGFFFDFEEDGWLVFSLLAEPAIFAQGVSYLAQAARSR